MQALFPGALIRDGAVRDLRDIVVDIGQRDLARAERFAEAFTETVRTLVSLPYMGSPRDFADVPIRELRMLPVQNFKMYLIWYHPLATHDGIEVVRVLHHKRDAQTLLADDESTPDDS